MNERETSVDDLAQLNRSEAKTPASELKFDTLLNYTYDWVYCLAPDGHFIYLSPSCERITGYRPEEFVNNPELLSTIIHPEDQPSIMEHFKNLDASGPHSFDFRIITHNGEVRWIAHACQAFFSDDGRWLGRCGNNRDITERKLAEEAAKIKERRLRSDLNISHLKTASLKALLDYALEEAISLSDSKIGYIYYYDEEKQEFTLHAWSKAVMAECTIPNPPTVYQLVKTGIWGEIVRQRKPLVINDFLAPNPLKKGYPGGHAKLHRYMSLPIFSDGKIVAVVAVANKEKEYTELDLQQLTLLMDSIWRVAERKRAEEELEKYKENLEELVKTRTAELELKNRQLAAEIAARKRTEELSRQYITEIERSNQELEEFAHIVSHDLQAPLRSIIGFSQLLEKGHADQLDATGRDYINTIVESGRRMQNMILEILEFARLKVDKQNMLPVDCETLLDEILVDLKYSIEELGAAITYDKLPTVIGIRSLLIQVFTNLIDNALKFHGPNVIQIHISAREEENGVVFSVKDNGIGFDPKHIGRIFQLFVRLHTEREYGGHGIGLSRCKKIINLHGGKIWAESKVGEGSTFFFTIPKKNL